MSDDKPTVANLLKNPSQRTPCVLVLDASDSMKATTPRGTRLIDELNLGVRTLEQELKDDPVAKMRVQLGIVSVGGPAGGADKMMDWTDAVDFQAFDLNHGNLTPLGEGLQIALEMIENQKEVYRSTGVKYTRPWIMVITDGAPTDSPDVWQKATKACRDAEAAKKCVIYPIGVADADMSVLQQISNTKALQLNEVKFKELFQWLSASLVSHSLGAPGETVRHGSTDPWAAVES